MPTDKLISFVIIAYRQERFIRACMEGAFAQTYPGPMEIVVCDDHSDDSTWEVIQQTAAAYQGPRPLVIHRNPVNLGINGNTNQAMALAKGDFVIFLGGDDVSLPGKTEKVVDRWLDGAMGVFNNAIIMDGDGRQGVARDNEATVRPFTLEGMVSYGNHGGRGPGFSWDKKIFTVFGPLPEKPVGEDAFVAFRAALLGRLDYILEPLDLWRHHGNNTTFVLQKSPFSRLQKKTQDSKHKQYFMDMFSAWFIDLETAEKAGVITPQRASWAKDLVQFHYRRVQCRLESRWPFIKNMILIWRKRNKLAGKAFWHLMIVEISQSPWLFWPLWVFFRPIKWIKGRATRSGVMGGL